MATILGQRCTVFLDEKGVQRFKIESSIDAVLPGDLPIYGSSPYSSNVFVHKIITTTDPKADTFLRVANVADLTTLPLGRETALGLNQTIYLSAEFIVTYDDIATASQAKLLIQQRVDNLIADWHTYNEAFLAPLTVPPDLSNITLPLTDSLEAQRKAAYNTAHAEYLVSQTADATAQATYAAATAAATAANEAAIAAVAESQHCSQMLGQFNVANTAVSNYRNAVNTFMTASSTFAVASAVYIGAGTSPSAPQLATFTAAKAAYDSAYAAMSAAVVAENLQSGPVLTSFATNIATVCTTRIADVAIAAQAKTNADAAAATAATEKKAADEAQSAALLADTNAYLSVKELCPDFLRTVP
jgi:hypothetical protein